MCFINRSSIVRELRARTEPIIGYKTVDYQKITVKGKTRILRYSYSKESEQKKVLWKSGEIVEADRKLEVLRNREGASHGLYFVLNRKDAETYGYRTLVIAAIQPTDIIGAGKIDRVDPLIICATKAFVLPLSGRFDPKKYKQAREKYLRANLDLAQKEYQINQIALDMCMGKSEFFEECIQNMKDELTQLTGDVK